MRHFEYVLAVFNLVEGVKEMRTRDERNIERDHTVFSVRCVCVRCVGKLGVYRGRTDGKAGRRWCMECCRGK